MSSTLETLQGQIETADDLSSIVRTMKTLAATSVRQYEKAAESLDDYYHTVELGLSVVLSSETELRGDAVMDPSRPALVMVFGSDHGLVGRFNEQIVSYALQEHWSEQPEQGSSHPQEILMAAAGEQAVSRLRAAGTGLVGEFGMPSSIGAITPFVQLLLEHIERWRSQEGIGRALLCYNRPLPGGFSPQADTMLPVSIDHLRQKRLRWESRSLPTFTMPAEELLSALLRQYFFVSLYRACALSLAAENTSRLAAMQAAEKNIAERLDELRTAFQQQRQAVITEELLDIISGFKSIRGSEDRFTAP